MKMNNRAIKNLSEQEEKVIRIKEGISLESEDLLERKTKNPDLLAKLLLIERAIIEGARRKK